VIGIHSCAGGLHSDERDRLYAQVKDAMRKLAIVVRHKRLDFRGILNDFDRTTKTRSGAPAPPLLRMMPTKT